MKIRITIEYDPDWNPGDRHLQLTTEIAHWEGNFITVSDVLATGGKVKYEMIGE